LSSACKLGVIAFGDSITNGAGGYQWGVPLQSWALWTARGLGLPYTPYAVDGAIGADVVAGQLPAFGATRADPNGRYDLGCIYIGTNDVRRPEWKPERFAVELETVHGALSACCDRRLAVTLPLDLGRPRARREVEEANAAIEAAAAVHGALLLDLRDFGARNLMMADHVHPTALGQVAIAERALAVLAADGLQTRARPSGMINYERGRWDDLRGDATYCYRHLKVTGRAAMVGLWSGRRRSLSR
jgi:lysophospholipase L1-like esterase